MRVARILTNETCNQNCAFCHVRRPAEDRAFVASARERIGAAARAGGEIVLTGGEPAMRRDLAELVAHARATGAERVTLETNGALVDERLAIALYAAGLDRARVHLPRIGPALDHVTRDPGGFRATLAGMAALAAAGVDLEVSAPVVRSTEDAIPGLPEGLARLGVPVRALELGVPSESPDPGEVLPPSQAAAIIALTAEKARALGLTIRISPDAPIPPCSFERPARVAHLYALTPGGRDRPGFQRREPCSSCAVEDRCPGFAEASLAAPVPPSARPIADDRVRRRLSIISSVEEQVERELYQDDIYLRDGGAAVPARIVRINFHCNQACRFCFVSTHLPRAEERAIERAIAGIAERGGVLVLSGGEPTLNPRLLEYVRLGRRLGASAIELQTNAVRLGEAGLAEQLKEAGVDHAFVSLHGSRAEISDAITEAPGTFDKTVLGIDAAVRAGLRTRVNFVFCQRNLEDFPRYVELVRTRWPEATVVVSFVAGSTDVVPRTPDLIPRYSDVLPHLAEGLRIARSHGVRVDGFESMCGVPLCLVPDDLGAYFELAEIPPGFDRGEFLYAGACDACTLRGRCFGVRRGYAELHGTSELRAVLPDQGAMSDPNR